LCPARSAPLHRYAARIVAICAALIFALAPQVVQAYSVDNSPFELPSPEMAGLPISAIVYEENERTRARILDRVLTIHVGDPLDRATVETTRQAILDTELFRTVRARVEDDGAGGVRVIFHLDERTYWAVYPRVSANSAGDHGYGLHSRFNNLFGLDHTLRLNLDQHDFDNADLGTSEEVRVRYSIPGISDSRYDVEFRADVVSLDRVEHDRFGAAVSLYNETEKELSVIALHWIGEENIGYGWRMGAGAHYRQQANEVYSGTLGRDAFIRQVGVSAQITYRRMHYHLFSDSGTEFGARYEQGLPRISDLNYQIVEVYGRRTWVLPGTEHSNLYLDMGVGISGTIDPNFVNFTFGRPSLRGLLKEVYDGDSYEYLRFGYLRPLFASYPAVRGEVFIDAGQERLGGFPNSTSSNVGIGTGIRWRIRHFVNLELTLGLVYSPDTHETVFWGGTHGLD